MHVFRSRLPAAADAHAVTRRQQYIRRHVNLFSVPHTVTEDLARQPGVSVQQITPASVRQFLCRSPGNIVRTAVADLFGHSSGSNSGSSGGPSVGGSTAEGHLDSNSGGGSVPSPDVDLLLELLEFCLSDCPPPSGTRPVPPVVASGGGSEDGSGGAAAVGEGGTGQGEEDGGLNIDAVMRHSREADEARQVRCSDERTGRGPCV